MKSRERQDNKRASLELLDPKYNHKTNRLHMGRHETTLNQLAQFFLAIEILESGNDFVSEGIFKNNLGRCDLIDLQSNVIYEVLDSESLKKFYNIKSKYPLETFPFIAKEVVELHIRKLIKQHNLKIV